MESLVHFCTGSFACINCCVFVDDQIFFLIERLLKRKHTQRPKNKKYQ